MTISGIEYPIIVVIENYRKWFIHIAASLAFGLILLDETVVAVALPTIQKEFSMSLFTVSIDNYCSRHATIFCKVFTEVWHPHGGRKSG